MTRADESAMRDGRRLTLVRNATVILELDGRRLLVDPMLDAVGVQPPVENTDNERRNPLVPLPIPADQVVADLDAVLVTHLHRDPFDDGAVNHLPRDVPVLCQPEDRQCLRLHGFGVRPVHGTVPQDGLLIRSQERPRFVFVHRDGRELDEPAWADGGSYMAYLKILQRPEQFAALPEDATRDQVIGRTRDGTRLDLAGQGTDPRHEPASRPRAWARLPVAARGQRLELGQLARRRVRQSRQARGGEGPARPARRLRAPVGSCGSWLAGTKPLHIDTGATGLEPATSGVTGRRSNQLNYAPKRRARV